MNIFGLGRPAQAPAGQTQAAQTPPAPPAGQGLPNQLDPKPQPQGLDKFQDLFKMDAGTGGGAPQTSIYDIPADKVQQLIGGQNFTSGLNPEQVQAALNGDVNAFMQVINTAAQNAAGFSLQSTMGALKASSTHERESWEKALPGQFKKLSASDKISEKNPIFRHEAAAPILESLKGAFLSKYPNATPDELADLAQSYLADFVDTVRPSAQPTPQQTAAANGTDWGTFFS